MRSVLAASTIMLALAATPVLAQTATVPAQGAAGTPGPTTAAPPGAQANGSTSTSTTWPSIATNVDGVPGANWGQDGTPVYVQPDGAMVTYSNVKH